MQPKVVLLSVVVLPPLAPVEAVLAMPEFRVLFLPIILF